MNMRTLLHRCAAWAVQMLLPALLLCSGNLSAQSLPDSLDVLHYELTADLGHATPRLMQGDAILRIVKLAPMDTATLDLQGAVVQAVMLNGDTTYYRYEGSRFLHIPLAGSILVGDTFALRVRYSTSGYVESYGFGGLHMDNSLYYNLGAGILTNPHAMGRSVLPCRDNFHDKATYRLTVTTAPGWTSLCSGQLESATRQADSSVTAVWNLAEPIPTYILSLSAAPFQLIHDTVAGDSTARATLGESPNIPLRIGFQRKDSNQVRQAFAMMHAVVPAFERCFGPYRWHTIGYIGTPVGSMEHANNIHLSNSCIASTTQERQSTAIHEFAHAWFGNLVTCATADDMWFNEGGASFCEEVGIEAAFGKAAADTYFREKMDRTQRTAHVDDGGWHPLHAQTWQNVYGTTVYQKGACVWHSLRSYLGDSLFYATMTSFFRHNAFGIIDSEALCDSLSLLSGTGLSDFFQFHVFSPGFQDFCIEALTPGTAAGSTLLTLRQTLRGTAVAGKSNKVPITFFGPQLQTAQRTFAVHGRYTGDDTTCHMAALPFTPVFAVVDLGKAFGYAGNADTATLTAKGNHAMPLCHFTANAHMIGDSTLFLAVTHHFTAPHTPTAGHNPGVLRTTQRYWTVDGLLPADSRTYGFFYYNAGGNASDADAYMDEGLCPTSTSFDSLQLLYRATPNQPWQALGSRHSGNSVSGYFITTRLRRGEYTLGIVDTATLSIPAADSAAAPRATFCPNPSNGTFTVHANAPADEFTVSIRNAGGTLLFTQLHCHDGSLLQPHLPQGIYVVSLSLPSHPSPFFSGKIVIQ